jgi:hypothetical protein
MVTPVSMAQGTLVVMRRSLASNGATTELRPAGRFRWLDALRTTVQAIRHVCLDTASTARVKDLALINMDPADLSELGRERRRQALNELREAQRRLQRNASAGVLSRRSDRGCYSNSIST